VLFLPTTFDVSGFKGKLVSHFVLLSLVPLVAANFGFWSTERNNAAREADRELRVGLRAASAAYADTVRAAQARAASVAKQSTFVAAVASDDRSKLARLARTNRLRVVTATDRFGLAAGQAARATATIVQGGRQVGRVTAFVELDASLVRTLRLRSGLPQDVRIAIAYRGTVVAGPGGGARLPATSAAPFSLQLAAGDYRALAVEIGPPKRTASLRSLRRRRWRRRGRRLRDVSVSHWPHPCW
jgi:hypothetical protein